MYTSSIDTIRAIGTKIKVHKYTKGKCMSYKTLRVKETEQIKLERAAIEISFKTGKQVQWTDVARYMFDNLLTDAKHGMIEDSKKD